MLENIVLLGKRLYLLFTCLIQRKINIKTIKLKEQINDITYEVHEAYESNKYNGFYLIYISSSLCCVTCICSANFSMEFN